MGCFIDGKKCRGCDDEPGLAKYVDLFRSRMIRLKMVRVEKNVRIRLLEVLKRRIEDLGCKKINEKKLK